MPTPTSYDDRPIIIEGPAEIHHVIARPQAVAIPSMIRDVRWATGLPEGELPRRGKRGHPGVRRLSAPRNDVVIQGWFFFFSGIIIETWSAGAVPPALQEKDSLSRKTKKDRIPEGIRSGTPEGTRTPDLLIRSQSLYPTELPAHLCRSLERFDIISWASKNVKHFFEKCQKFFVS